MCEFLTLREHCLLGQTSKDMRAAIHSRWWGPDKLAYFQCISRSIGDHLAQTPPNLTGDHVHRVDDHGPAWEWTDDLSQKTAMVYTGVTTRIPGAAHHELLALSTMASIRTLVVDGWLPGNFLAAIPDTLEALYGLGRCETCRVPTAAVDWMDTARSRCLQCRGALFRVPNLRFVECVASCRVFNAVLAGAFPNLVTLRLLVPQELSVDAVRRVLPHIHVACPRLRHLEVVVDASVAACPPRSEWRTDQIPTRDGVDEKDTANGATAAASRRLYVYSALDHYDRCFASVDARAGVTEVIRRLTAACMVAGSTRVDDADSKEWAVAPETTPDTLSVAELHRMRHVLNWCVLPRHDPTANPRDTVGARMTAVHLPFEIKGSETGCAEAGAVVVHLLLLECDSDMFDTIDGVFATRGQAELAGVNRSLEAARKRTVSAIDQDAMRAAASIRQYVARIIRLDPTTADGILHTVPRYRVCECSVLQ